MTIEVRRRPNMHDVAARAGVSHQTVSRVLNGFAGIRPDTRARVLAAIDELGYRPNQAARALVTSRSRTIGVLSESSAQYGPATALHALEVAARSAGYRALVTSSTGDDESVRAGLEFLLGQSVEALVVIASQRSIRDALAGTAVPVPMVTLDSLDDDDHDALYVDQYEGALLATRHLVELGHSRILHLGGPPEWGDARARRQAYTDVLREAGLEPLPVLLGDWMPGAGYAAGEQFARRRPATAVFCANDQMALGFVHAVTAAGLSVPGDVSVVGFDDIPEAAHFLPPLTTVRQDFAELGRRAIDVLLAELSGDREAVHAPVPARFVERASTAPPA
ncbi:DNA-binding LacI/PurR family transcriptional regulator [Diaminobutyricimonas aerilata]|uniref:DNA-binding LacI/PurR family transcriptional regulator n=1 Tax=Diaminobutyricimonas aerilata TaxID=1162967 RepID=A0A2M9CGK7_9MICO|nr:LacI family DNA-binding transcriptional regulator [Diaminobutyricimonas aerilata]PJJ71064.1 DNA-binding LacI/PurR family transcriptional regulator [Diaminobutyricimonas aerilata]